MTTGSAQGGARERFVVTEAERQVADLLPIEVAPVLARATVETVPFWFHTFALNRAEGIYTPGAARYRVSALPEDFAGMSVLDVGCFDGFYAFLAERKLPAGIGIRPAPAPYGTVLRGAVRRAALSRLRHVRDRHLRPQAT